ncbi:hypothetical protein [Caloramator sp. ALD01]|uniref:hypothetical protein n=1 Tax=Caloramator sp. ALD01 TaxID=1031288 RepID=UPI00040C211A|nr:hypothetical protein [Caloramator sp. ALD01]
MGKDILIIYAILGAYGYYRFLIILLSLRKLKSNSNNLKKNLFNKACCMDLLIGLITICILLKYFTIDEREPVFIIMLFSISLILSGLRIIFNIFPKKVVYRKIYNYVANSYIIISAWMIGEVLNNYNILMAFELSTGFFLLTFFTIYYINYLH